MTTVRLQWKHAIIRTVQSRPYWWAHCRQTCLNSLPTGGETESAPLLRPRAWRQEGESYPRWQTLRCVEIAKKQSDESALSAAAYYARCQSYRKPSYWLPPALKEDASRYCDASETFSTWMDVNVTDSVEA